MQQRHRELARLVQEFVSQHSACQRIPGFFGHNGQPNPAVEIAKGLVGQYLLSIRNNLVIRILETEAYLESETALYHRKFYSDDINNFKTAAGTLVLWETANSISPLCHQLVMTTGDNSSGDVVLLKSCEIITYGLVDIDGRIDSTRLVGLERIEGPGGVTRRRDKNINLLLGPLNVAKRLEPELTGNNNVLDARGGLRLYDKDPTGETILGGKRVLPKDCHFKYSNLPYAGREYRFALGVTGARYPASSFLHPCGALG